MPQATAHNTYEEEQTLYYQLQNRLVALKYRPGAARAAAHYADLEDRALDVADRLVDNIKACVAAARRARGQHSHRGCHGDTTIRRWEELNRMCRELAAEAGRLRAEAGRVRAAAGGGGLCVGARTRRGGKGAKQLDVPTSFVEEGCHV